MLLSLNHNNNTMSCTQKQKSLDFLSNSNFTTRKLKLSEICVVDGRYLCYGLTIFILSQWWQHLTLPILFCGKFVSCSNFYSVLVLIVLILWVKVWYLLFACIVIKLGQKKHLRLKSWEGKYQPHKNVFGEHKQPYYWVFCNHFDFESVSSHTKLTS